MSGSDSGEKDCRPPKSVDKVAVATKHPGVFMVTCELEAETGQKLRHPTPEPAVKEEKEDETVEEVAARSPLTRRKKSAKRSAPKTEEKSVELYIHHHHEVEKAVSEKPAEVLSETSSKPAKGLPEASQKPAQALLETSQNPTKGVSESSQAAGKEPTRKMEETWPEETSSKMDVASENEVEIASAVEVPSKDQEKKGEEAREERGDDDGEDAQNAAPPTTRRSKRREQLLQLKAKKEAVVFAQPEQDPELGYESVEDVDMEDSASADRFDVESVGSELESLESGASSKMDSSSSLRKVEKSKSSKKSSKSKSKSKTASAVNLKGKSRRAIFKKSSTKAPTAVAKAITSDRILHKGRYLTKGDIVSVLDLDGGVYYAQLKGFLCDQYCEKSGVITWLLPTVHSPPPEEGFDPATYVIGPEEELPRRLEHFTFVMHAPDDYFHYKNAPYPTNSIATDQEYLLTRFGPKIRLLKGGKTVYT